MKRQRVYPSSMLTAAGAFALGGDPEQIVYSFLLPRELAQVWCTSRDCAVDVQRRFQGRTPAVLEVERLRVFCGELAQRTEHNWLQAQADLDYVTERIPDARSLIAQRAGMAAWRVAQLESEMKAQPGVRLQVAYDHRYEVATDMRIDINHHLGAKSALLTPYGDRTERAIYHAMWFAYAEEQAEHDVHLDEGDSAQWDGPWVELLAENFCAEPPQGYGYGLAGVVPQLLSLFCRGFFHPDGMVRRDLGARWFAESGRNNVPCLRTLVCAARSLWSAHLLQVKRRQPSICQSIGGRYVTEMRYSRPIKAVNENPVFLRFAEVIQALKLRFATA